MTLAVRAVFWVIAYLGAVVTPLVFAAIGGNHPDHGFWTNFSVALGFVGLAMLGLEFALVARFRPVAAPFGQDALLQFHRQIGYVGLAFILVHFAISAKWSELTPAKAVAARPGARVVRDAPSARADRVDRVVGLWKQVLWALMSGAFVLLLLWVRLVKPRRARPWRLERVTAERGGTTTLTLRPPPAAGFRFEPGQFGWFVFGGAPFSLTQHPFSFSSSAEREDVGSRAAAGLPTLSVLHLRPGADDGRRGVRADRVGRAGRPRAHRALRHGV
jgi:predicted ferric reductase